MSRGTDTASRESLSVRAVSKAYANQPALNNVSLDVNAGEFVALLGPNGAGKSTLFQLMSGLFLPDTGSIFIAGKDLHRDPVSALAQLGIVFQQISLDLDLSVKRNLKIHCDLYGVDEAAAKIKDALDWLQLQSVQNKPCRALSGGNRRKVELIRSMLHRPGILLMDEATVGLDPASRERLLGEVRSLCREQGLAVVWATHLVDEAVDANKVIILHRGAVLQQGTPQSIVEATGEADLLGAFLALTSPHHGADGV